MVEYEKLVRSDRTIDLGAKCPVARAAAGELSLRWSRALDLGADRCRCHARADHGIRILVDDELVLDEWHEAGGADVYQIDRTVQGRHRLSVAYYDGTDEVQVKVRCEKR